MPLPRAGRRLSALLPAVAATAAAALIISSLCVGSADAAPSATTAAITRSAPTVGATTPTHGSLSRHDRAELALARAKRAFSWSTPADERPDATMALHRLWTLKDALSPAERHEANGIGGRPSADQVDCASPIACIHWNSTTASATWAATVRDTITYVGDLYRASGYRATLPDGPNDASAPGGGPQTDVYIAPLQPGLYGYCKPTGKRKKGSYAMAAFCVLDNDYAGFPAHTPLENLQVTAAHEFFHATQFAYDAQEDPWFLEATAVWVEDEVYPDVNDDLQYLARSPITNPKTSLDTFENGGSFHYGVWNFFRYLTEKYPTLQGSLPVLVLDMWQYADSTRGPRKDLYSLQAINKALRKVEHSSLAKEFALYSDATRRTHTTFAEGAALNYPVKHLAAKEKPLAKQRAQASFSTRLNHLTSATYRFDSVGLAPGSKLRLRLDMAPKATGSEAVVSTYRVDGSVTTKIIKVNRQGDRTKKVLFGSDQVVAVEVTLVNAGTQFRACYRGATPYSCYGGTPIDQREQESLTGRVV